MTSDKVCIELTCFGRGKKGTRYGGSLERPITVATWSSGMIPASGAGGPGFNSRSGPYFCRHAEYNCNFKYEKLTRANKHIYIVSENHDPLIVDPGRLLVEVT